MMALGAGLGALFLKAFAVIGATLVAHARLHDRSAALRHGVLATGFGVLIVLTVSQAVLPTIPLEVLPGSSPAVAPEVRLAVTAAPLEVAPGAVSSIASPGRVTAGPAATQREGVVWPAALIMWLVGTIVLVLGLVVDVVRLALIARRGAPPEAVWDPTIQRAARVLGRSRVPAEVRISDPTPVAAVWGIAHPVVVLPGAARSWSARRLEIVLTHEFAHVARRDPLTTIVAELAVALYWPNPLVWLARRKLRFEREAACDERVLGAGTACSLYADELLNAARDLRGRLRPGIAMATRSGLHRRIETILSYEGSRPATFKHARPVVATALILVGPLLGACRAVPGHTGDGRANHDSPDPRIRATWALGDLEDPSAVPELVSLLDDENPELRGMAAWALGEIKDRAAATALLTRLGDPDPVAREMFVRALGELRDLSAIAPLEELLSDSHAPVRAAAVWALGEFGGAGPWRAIARSTADTDVAVRRTAIQVLAESGTARAGGVLRAGLQDPAPVIRALAARRLGEIGVDAIDPLIAALDDPAPEVRREVARTLGMVGDARALDALINHLRDEDLEVRSWAVWALDEIDPEVDPAHPKADFDRERLVGVTN